VTDVTISMSLRLTKHLLRHNRLSKIAIESKKQEKLAFVRQLVGDTLIYQSCFLFIEFCIAMLL